MSKAPDLTAWDGIIVTDEDNCFRKARIAGTRMYLDHLLGLIECGYSLNDILAEDPDIPVVNFKPWWASPAIWLPQSATV